MRRVGQLAVTVDRRVAAVGGVGQSAGVVAAEESRKDETSGTIRRLAATRVISIKTESNSSKYDKLKKRRLMVGCLR